jgi:hypothetical protein
MDARALVGPAVPTSDERREELTVMALRLAAVADSVAAVLEELAESRDRLADISRTGPGRLRTAARRARGLAAVERREAERLRRVFLVTRARRPDRLRGRVIDLVGDGNGR